MNATAARGTAVLALSRGCYFILGYLAVVLLARELGPAIYGTYGVIISVLVWLEESGRYAIPSATAKLLAEITTGHAELERNALTLNLGLHVLFFVLLWVAAPGLASWFGIANGTLLFRLAALDLPCFGAYTAYQAIHQGYYHFFRLGLSQVIYALAKLIGVLLLIHFGVSLERALLVNAAATVIGLMVLLPGTSLQWKGCWLERVAPLVSVAVPMGLYFFPLMLRSSLLLGTLRIMSPVSEEVWIGILVAALNVARVPAFTLATVTIVLLPSLSRALARHDVALAKRYINQALRFFFILYLPVSFVLMAQPEQLMQWIYSQEFAGGGLLLSILVVGEGMHTLQAILGSVLNAAGEARKAAAVTILSLIPSLAMLVIFIHFLGVIGAALSSALMPLFGVVIFSGAIWQRFGTLLKKRSLCNIGLAGSLMFLVDALFPEADGFFILLHTIGLVVYVASLVVLGEITRQDVASFLPWQRIQRQAVT